MAGKKESSNKSNGEKGKKKIFSPFTAQKKNKPILPPPLQSGTMTKQIALREESAESQRNGMRDEGVEEQILFLYGITENDEVRPLRVDDEGFILTKEYRVKSEEEGKLKEDKYGRKSKLYEKYKHLGSMNCFSPLAVDGQIMRKMFFNREVILHIHQEDGDFVIFDVSELNGYSFAVINNTNDAIETYVQISPDSVHYFTDTIPFKIEPLQMETISPVRFLKYAKVVVKGKGTGEVTVYLQGQTLG
ncbi:DUF6385 domain-containing protein [Bacillus sp. BP-3]|uniref:DUF6385 domain-containing protein n=1 Tax=Bacillus sp. BP-3 TaxID=3022773 RepID=UPI00232E34A6|nr:DUF6385 domain-containing protein [Bacillus sp. BP-3]MDC2864586.1 DUF6385 domain-containing protein [Bacillus sp. BP-3]